MQLMLLGTIFIIIGFIYKLFPPRKINSIYGWRTPLAMKNQTIWNEANRFGAILFILGGVFLASAAYIFGVLFEHAGRFIFMPLVLGTVIAIFIIGEVRLRKMFDKDGNIKN